MSNYRRSGRNNHNQSKPQQQEKSVEDTPLMACFRKYATELDAKHDRHERLVKLGRDITIESKRIIFLLHTIDRRKDNREKVVHDAEQRLKVLFETNFLNIAKELDGLDQHQFVRAFCWGLQEFIEAYTFCEYLKGAERMSNWDDLQARLTYEVDTVPSTGDMPTLEEISPENLAKKQIYCLVKPTEYLLGVADVGGEIMRRCINSLGSNDIEACTQSCRTLQALYAGFLRIGAIGLREMTQKITTLRESTLKTENVCYNIKIRGTEAAKWNTTGTAVFITDKEEEDEGFY